MSNLFIISLCCVLISILIHTQMSSTLSFSETCENASKLVERYENLPNSTNLILSTKLNIKKTLEILDEALTRYNHDEIALSYNGGKDCLLMLLLLLAQIHRHYKSNIPFNSILTVLINDEEQFPALLEFIDQSSKQYSLNVVRYDNTLKAGFTQFLKEHSNIKAVIVGVRRSDPYASDLKYFHETDNDWPKFMRINPVLEWNYEQVWSFLKELEVDYCRLYDLGYTSIGGIDTTVRNPHLLQEDGNYQPAFELHGKESDLSERDGRSSIHK